MPLRIIRRIIQVSVIVLPACLAVPGAVNAQGRIGSRPNSSAEKQTQPSVAASRHITITQQGKELPVHYLEAGPEEGLPVVLLHGARFNAATWQKTGTIGALTRAGFHVFAVDLPGSGRSPFGDADRTTFLGALLGQLTKRRAVVVSPSRSGRFSLPLLASNSPLLAGFVAVAPVAIRENFSRLTTVTVPTLVIWGEKDRVVPLSQADILVERIVGARKVIIPEAKHPCYLDDPERFNREVVSFVRDVMTEEKVKGHEATRRGP